MILRQSETDYYFTRQRESSSLERVNNSHVLKLGISFIYEMFIFVFKGFIKNIIEKISEREG